MSASEASAERAQLVDAAWVVLSARGSTGLTVAEVLAEARLGTRAFYRQFRSKDELVLAVFEREQQRVVDRLWAAVSTASDGASALTAWIDEYLSLAFRARRAGRTKVLLAEGSRLTGAMAAELQRANERSLDPLVAAIERGIADATLRSPAVDADARSLLALAWDLNHRRLTGRLSTSDATPARDHLVGLALRAMRAPDADLA